VNLFIICTNLKLCCSFCTRLDGGGRAH